MDFAFTAEAGLAGLFLASFLSATLLPGGSEAVLFAVIRLHPEQTLPALLLARVDGKSPVEYITDDRDREKVRRVARPLLLKPADRLAPIRDAWRADIAKW